MEKLQKNREVLYLPQSKIRPAWTSLNVTTQTQFSEEDFAQNWYYIIHIL
jgi:hypothetical protein